jgi:hypothetical protein
MPQVAAIVKFLTAKRGRSYRGRIYIPFVAENTTTAGKLGPTPVANTTTAWIAFHTALTSATLDMCVASYKNATQEPIIALACETYTATQRRRLKRNSS